MKRLLGCYGLVLAAVLLLSFVFFTLNHEGMPEWAVTAISLLFAVFIGLLIYFIIRRFRS